MSILPWIKATAKGLWQSVDRNLPTYLSWAAVIGVPVTAGLVAVETPAFLKEMEEEGLTEKELILDRPWDTAKVVARNYWPAALSMGCTCACIISANKEGMRRHAAAVAAYQLSALNLQELKDKIVEEQGEKKLKELQDKIAQDHMDKDPPKEDMIVKTGYGMSLCKEPFTGQYFYTNYKNVFEAANMVNMHLLNGEFVPASDFFYDIRLPEPNAKDADNFGWEMTEPRFDSLLKVSFGECRAPNGEPCNELIYNLPPDRRWGGSSYPFRG